MIVFIDESGVHKTDGHSCFSLVYVTTDNAEFLEHSIIEIERQNRMSVFHWTDQPWKLRSVFLQAVAKLPFTAKVALFRNPIIETKALEWALRHVLVEKNFRAIILDGKKPKWVERQLKKVLRDNGISVKKLKTVRQESSAGVRLADAIAGLSRTYFDDPCGRAQPLWRCIEYKITTQLVGGQTDR
ncbi:DUF3800 domain-containing protein [Candidatus Uhrbacteria bacterium]|nr:DUF3800 domain-containing protein [Candidatus Uhrbacteria bacterium]